MIAGFFEILTRQMNVREVADIPNLPIGGADFSALGALGQTRRGYRCRAAVHRGVGPLVGVGRRGDRLGIAGGIIFKHARCRQGRKSIRYVEVPRYVLAGR